MADLITEEFVKRQRLPLLPSPTPPMENPHPITTRLLTLLNVSATKFNKRKRTDDEFVPAEKLNKRKPTAFVEPTNNQEDSEDVTMEAVKEKEIVAEEAEEEENLNEDVTEGVSLVFGFMNEI